MRGHGRETDEANRLMWLKRGRGLEESRLFEHVLYRELRDSYPDETSPAALLDRLMRDAYVATRPRNRKVTHSRCVAVYLPSRFGWWVSDVSVGGRRLIRSIRFGSWWIPVWNAYVPFQFSIQRLLARWYFSLGEQLGLSSTIFVQAERLRGSDVERQAARLPRWVPGGRDIPVTERPLEGLETLYRAGALHLIEAPILRIADAARPEGEQGNR